MAQRLGAAPGVTPASDGRTLCDLGDRYYEERGVAQDDVRARDCRHKAAAASNARAMWAFGRLYAEGQGVARSHRKAREWYQKAAAANRIVGAAATE